MQILSAMEKKENPNEGFAMVEEEEEEEEEEDHWNSCV
jgi:hypothetical protein